VAGNSARGAAAPLSETGPNILFVMADDQGCGKLGCHGNPLQKTPAFDRLRAAFDACWEEVRPATEANESARWPYLNPFLERYWCQLGDDRTRAQVARMSPVWKFVELRPKF
jgi:hypothetical protein